MQVSPEQLDTALRRLGTSVAALQAIQRHPDPPTALQVWKDRVKQAWRKLAFSLHPDRGGNEDDFKHMSTIVDRMLALKFQPRLPPQARAPMHVRVHVVRPTVIFTNASTTSTTGFTNANTYWRPF